MRLLRRCRKWRRDYAGARKDACCRSAQLVERVDWTLLTLWFALLSVGFVMVASASVEMAASNHGDAWYFVKRHGIWLMLGLTAAMFVAVIPMDCLAADSTTVVIAGICVVGFGVDFPWVVR